MMSLVKCKFATRFLRVKTHLLCYNKMLSVFPYNDSKKKEQKTFKAMSRTLTRASCMEENNNIQLQVQHMNQKELNSTFQQMSHTCCGSRKTNGLR